MRLHKHEINMSVEGYVSYNQVTASRVSKELPIWTSALENGISAILTHKSEKSTLWQQHYILLDRSWMRRDQCVSFFQRSEFAKEHGLPLRVKNLNSAADLLPEEDDLQELAAIQSHWNGKKEINTSSSWTPDLDPLYELYRETMAVSRIQLLLKELKDQHVDLTGLKSQKEQEVALTFSKAMEIAANFRDRHEVATSMGLSLKFCDIALLGDFIHGRMRLVDKDFQLDVHNLGGNLSEDIQKITHRNQQNLDWMHAAGPDWLLDFNVGNP